MLQYRRFFGLRALQLLCNGTAVHGSDGCGRCATENELSDRCLARLRTPSGTIAIISYNLTHRAAPITLDEATNKMVASTTAVLEALHRDGVDFTHWDPSRGALACADEDLVLGRGRPRDHRSYFRAPRNVKALVTYMQLQPSSVAGMRAAGLKRPAVASKAAHEQKAKQEMEDAVVATHEQQIVKDRGVTAPEFAEIAPSVAGSITRRVPELVPDLMSRPEVAAAAAHPLFTAGVVAVTNKSLRCVVHRLHAIVPCVCRRALPPPHVLRRERRNARVSRYGCNRRRIG